MRSGAHHVLVVEDDEDTAEVVQSTLEEAGYDVAAVSNGAEALSYLARVSERCVVLLDLVMVDMNGWDVLSALRSSDRRDHVIVMSGMVEPSLPRGVPLLRKPFNAEQLLEMVRSRATA